MNATKFFLQDQIVVNQSLVSSAKILKCQGGWKVVFLEGSFLRDLLCDDIHEGTGPPFPESENNIQFFDGSNTYTSNVLEGETWTQGYTNAKIITVYIIYIFMIWKTQCKYRVLETNAPTY